MKVIVFLLSVVSTIVVTLSLTELQSHMVTLLRSAEDKPQHRTISLKPKEEPSLWDKGIDGIATMFGFEAPKPKSNIQKLMDRRRREIAEEKARESWRQGY
ncbi:hypothetical protein [Ruegeria sp. HKCCD8929]|uniref:hypothetical protein n=1 Tax=Ruegeria sp. HKCCD8929 TaxID=2683006 RepID=UPI0014879B47|nr:hypothetical protein [Ruegeria sp. HKCCD8929]